MEVLLLIRHQSDSFTIIILKLALTVCIHDYLYTSLSEPESSEVCKGIFDVCMYMSSELMGHLGGFLCTVLLQIHKTCLEVAQFVLV